jgi:3-deoxy-D-manno-octulosonate 8-phosphate phosphatase (KDO 8-P phosphatase)
MSEKKTMIKKLRPIKMVLLDVDGVLTDGGIYYSAAGAEMKRFNAHDGYGVVRAREHGLTIGIISGRRTPIVEVRAKEMGIVDVMQGASDKVVAMEELRKRYGIEPNEIAYIGDDLFDLPLLNVVGFSAAPANALQDVRKSVDYVTRSTGGNGAVRELLDLIIRHSRA